MVLCHHGVPGQKWGVRNGPPYPIEDKVMRKGTRLNTVTVLGKNQKHPKNKWLYTYNPNDAYDSAVYKGPFAKYKLSTTDNGINSQMAMLTGKSWVNERSYEVVKDLKMPTRKEREDIAHQVIAKMGNTAIKELQDIQDQMKRFDVGSKLAKTVPIGKRNIVPESKKEDYDKAIYEIFGHQMEYADYYKTTQEYKKIMSKKYDAMVDDNNQGIYNNAHDPVIIFSTNVLKEIGETRALTLAEIEANVHHIRDKNNGRIML